MRYLFGGKNLKKAVCETITTVQYLGNKQRIIDDIFKEVMSFKDRNTFVDLFGGTGSVSYAFRNDFEIISNDLQIYSTIIMKAIMKTTEFTYDEEVALYKKIKEISSDLEKSLTKELQKERYFLYENKEINEYVLFNEETPHICDYNDAKDDFSGLKRFCEDIRFDKKQQDQIFVEPRLFTTYYSNTYFGIMQCVEIDAIRGAIECNYNNKENNIRNVLLACLMSAMSNTVNSTTHFAQYLKIKNEKTAKDVIKKRKVSIVEEFKKKIDDFFERGVLARKHEESNRNHMIYNMDYNMIFDRLKEKNGDCIIYADPPYFKEHYSRYYHILDTLCIYDYPSLTYNKRLNDITVGRYRNKRLVSPFGKKSMALEAFENLIRQSANKEAVLIISYSDNSIVSLENIIEKMEEKFYVQTRYIPINHSKQGRKSTKPVNEVILIGEIRDNKADRNKISGIPNVKPLFDNPCSAMHNYMARKPYNIVNRVIEAYTPENGVVFDPFCGSGTTLIEARKLGIANIGVDISRQAYLITKITLNRWDINDIEKELVESIDALSARINDIYRVNINDEIRIIERCHFDNIDNRLLPTSYWYKNYIDEEVSSKRIKDIANSKFIDEYYLLDNEEKGTFKDYSLMTNVRIAINEGASVDDYFCARNKKAMKLILEFLSNKRDTEYYELYELIISSAINLIKLSDKKASSQIPYWRPKKDITSRNAAFILKKKCDIFIKGLRYINDFKEGELKTSFSSLKRGDSLVINKPIQNISSLDIPSNSVDLVFTDPPYTDQVPYLEYAQLTSQLLDWNLLSEENLNNEIVVSNALERPEKNVDDFIIQMNTMMSVVSSKLKESGHLVMFYHDFTLKAWSNIVEAAKKHGMYYVDQVEVQRQRKTMKTVMSPNSTLEGNYLIIFSKNKVPTKELYSVNEYEKRCKEVARDIILKMGGAATSKDLYDKGMLLDSIENNYLKDISIKYKTFVDIVKNEFDFKEGYWRIKDVLADGAK